MKSILLAFSALAGCGLVLSVAAHLAALAGITPFSRSPFALHVGIFIVWFPAVLVAQRQTREFKQKDFWKAALRGAPPWMRWLTYSFFAYALVNFAYFFLTTVGNTTKHTGPPDAATLRGFSGHWMAFYAAAMSILYSSARIPTFAARRCTQGHPVGELAQFCEKCGSPVFDAPSVPPAV